MIQAGGSRGPTQRNIQSGQRNMGKWRNARAIEKSILITIPKMGDLAECNDHNCLDESYG